KRAGLWKSSIRHASRGDPPRFPSGGPAMGRLSRRQLPLLRRAFHRLDDLRIGCAAAEIPGEVVLDLVVVRIRMAVEQLLGHEDESGRAEAALERAVLDEGFLHGVERAIGV